jgi:hypothetical protein
MTAHSQSSPNTAAISSATVLKQILRQIRAARMHFMECANVCADYYAAAALYERLSGLSDAELHRRGLSRATLARDVRLACDGD